MLGYAEKANVGLLLEKTCGDDNMAVLPGKLLGDAFPVPLWNVDTPMSYQEMPNTKS
jgi:hypothetical protein